MSLIEVLVAMSVISIALLGGYTAVNYFQLDSAQQRQRFEASSLATQYEELFQAYAYYDAGNVAPGTYSYTRTIGANSSGAGGITYNVTVNVSLNAATSGANSPKTICVSSTTLETGNTWGVTVTVSWNRMQGAAPVIQNTTIAPGQAGAEALANASIGVPFENLDGTPFTLATVHWVLAAVATGSSSGSAPALPSAGKTNYASSNGCAEVNNLAVDPGWGYEITLSGNPNIVTDDEQSDQTRDDIVGPMQVYAGEVTKASPVIVGKGQNEAVVVQPVTYACGTNVKASCFAPASGAGSFAALTNVPVSVGNVLLPGGFYTFGNGTAATPTSMLLFPFSLGYTVWSGDSTQSSQGYSGYNGTLPASISVYASGSGSVTVPVYNMPVNVASAQSGSSITATETGGANTQYTLNSAGASNFNGGLPLGQYVLGATGGASLTQPTYVWVTPTGLCTSSTVMSGPCTTPSTAPVSVTE